MASGSAQGGTSAIGGVSDDLRRLAPGVDGAFQRDRPGAAGRRDRDGLGDARRRLLRRADAFAVFDDVPQQADLIVDLVQVAVPLVDREGRDLARQRDHRRAHRRRQQQRGRGVQDARPRHHRERLRLAGHQRGPERHVGSGLLVARVDDADAVGRLVRGIEQMVVVHARQREQRVDAVRQQGFDDGFGRGHAGHCVSSGYFL